MIRFHYLGELVEPKEGCATDGLPRVARPAARVECDLQSNITFRRPREVAEGIADSGRRLDRVARVAEDGPQVVTYLLYDGADVCLDRPRNRSVVIR